MAVVTIDSSDMAAVIAEATRDPMAPRERAPNAEEKPAADAKAAEKTAAEDEEEDENGLTAAQRAELSAKMLKAIGKKHRQLKEAEEFAAAQYNEKRLIEQRAAELERQLQEAKGATAKPEEKPAAKPERKDFSDDVAYVEALTDWKVAEQMKKIQADQEKAAAERAHAEMIAAAKARIDRARELVPDFAETVESVDQVVPPAVGGYMQQSEMFAELGYYFAKNPAELERIAKMAPAMQLVTIGKIEATLSPFSAIADGKSDAKPAKTEPDAKPAKATASDDTAPQPSKARTVPVITPLSSSGVAQVGKDEAEMNPRELIQSWARQNKVDFSRRKRH